MKTQTLPRSLPEARKVSTGSAAGSRTELAVRGMTCNNCARHVAEAIQAVPGVLSATISLEEGRASIRWLGQTEPDEAAVLRAVANAGYQGKIVKPEEEHECHEHSEGRQAGWEINLWIAVLSTAILMLGEWVFGWGIQRWFQWLGFAIASAVQVLAGARFYRGAWSQLKVGRSNMDTLVALGSTTAYAYSAWALFSGSGSHLYFMEAAAIIALVSIGHWFEARASAQASSALRALLNLAPALARRRSADGSEAEVSLTELRVNDLVVLRPGDRVPVDGEVVEGASAVDESMLTGESLPVDKASDQPVYAGTVNVNGRLLMRITATGEQTALAQIILAVQRAQNSRANIQRLGDRVSSVFVPIVVLVATAAGLWWGLVPESAHRVHDFLSPWLWPAHPPVEALPAALIAAAAVLIVACPCAMGLATPAAIMAGSNAAAQRGILIRDGAALEKAGRITAVLFDKTGTLTLGKPQLVRFVERGAWSVERDSSEAPSSETVRIAAGLARHSSHPLSQTLARFSDTEVPFEEWQEVRGGGLVARWRREAAKSGTSDKQGEWMRLGSIRWLGESEVDLAPGRAFEAEWTTQGATILGLAREGELLAMFALKDNLKSGARDVVQQLQRQGLKIYLVTGDNPRTANSIARQAGIRAENVFADVRPELKAELVKKLQAQGESVAFVGEGINDAPALEQANLGIAVARASDVAREAADIVLLRSEIEAVPESLGLAKATLRTIKQNLFWAFFYNAAGVPLAALGFLSPVLCAAAMGLSDLIVIGNALRLKRWRM